MFETKRSVSGGNQESKPSAEDLLKAVVLFPLDQGRRFAEALSIKMSAKDRILSGLPVLPRDVVCALECFLAEAELDFREEVNRLKEVKRSPFSERVLGLRITMESVGKLGVKIGHSSIDVYATLGTDLIEHPEIESHHFETLGKNVLIYSVGVFKAITSGFYFETLSGNLEDEQSGDNVDSEWWLMELLEGIIDRIEPERAELTILALRARSERLKREAEAAKRTEAEMQKVALADRNPEQPSELAECSQSAPILHPIANDSGIGVPFDEREGLLEQWRAMFDPPPSDRRLYTAKNKPCGRTSFNEWKRKITPRESRTSMNIERFLRDGTPLRFK